MRMRGQDERRFNVKLTHQKDYQFISQASEDGCLQGDPYVSDEPDPAPVRDGGNGSQPPGRSGRRSQLAPPRSAARPRGQHLGTFKTVGVPSCGCSTADSPREDCQTQCSDVRQVVHRIGQQCQTPGPEATNKFHQGDPQVEWSTIQSRRSMFAR